MNVFLLFFIYFLYFSIKYTYIFLAVLALISFDKYSFELIMLYLLCYAPIYKSKSLLFNILLCSNSKSFADTFVLLTGRHIRRLQETPPEVLRGQWLRNKQSTALALFYRYLRSAIFLCIIRKLQAACHASTLNTMFTLFKKMSI